MMQQQQDAANNEFSELKPTTTSGVDGSICNIVSNSIPSTPTARIRFPLVRTGRDSGYGTDYSPSPSSQTSSHHFVFNDDMVAGAGGRSDVMLALSSRLEKINVGSSDTERGSEYVIEDGCDRNSDDNEEEDDDDNEVRNINNVNNSSCQFELSEERPSAPLPSSEMDTVTNEDPHQVFGDVGNTMAPVIRPLTLKIEDNGSNVSNKDSSQTRTVQLNGPPQVEHLSRDRSHSMPNVRSVREQEVGRQLRRLSDDFFNFHYNRRRHRTLSVESSAIPLQVNIEMYACRTHTDRHTNNNNSSDNDETDAGNRH